MARGAKSSGFTESLALPGGSATGAGWEEGAHGSSRGRRSVPATPDPVSAPPARAVARAAVRLREAAEAALSRPGEPPELTVRVAAGAVEWRTGAKRSRPPEVIGAATLAVGEDPFAPRWSRIAPLDRLGLAARWPAGWLEAAAREGDLRTDGLRPGDPPDLAARAGSLVVDALAAGDLLRLEAARWAEGAVDPGAPVAAALVLVRDARPGTAGAVPPAGSIVEAGRLLPRAQTRGAGGLRPTGSWRAGGGPAWGELLLEVAGTSEPWPAAGPVLTRILPLRGGLFGAGHLRRGGRAVARWGPVPIPPPGWFLARVAAPLGVAVRDVTGAPVACPPLAVRWGAGRGGR